MGDGTADNRFHIGANTDGRGSFQGDIAEMRMFSGELTAAEIQAEMNNGCCPTR